MSSCPAPVLKQVMRCVEPLMRYEFGTVEPHVRVRNLQSPYAVEPSNL